MFWNIEDLEDLYLRTPTREVLTKIASLDKWEFTQSYSRYEFKDFIHYEIPRVLGKSLMGKYLIVQEWALRSLWEMQNEVSTSSGEQKSTINCYVKEEKTLLLTEKKTEKQDSDMVENEKCMLSTNKNSVPLSLPSPQCFHGDDLIAF
jgi:hypothetical protein